MNKPVCLGVSTLELCKKVIHKFWYDYAKQILRKSKICHSSQFIKFMSSQKNWFSFYGHFRDFFFQIWRQNFSNVIWSIFRVTTKIFGECEGFEVHFQKIYFSNLLLIQKHIFQVVENTKKCILTLTFTFWGQLACLKTSRHAIRSSWIFEKLMPVKYTFWLQDTSGCKKFVNKMTVN